MRTTAPQPTSGNPSHLRMARLTAEYIDATPERQAKIDAEVQGMLDGKVESLRIKRMSETLR